MADQSRPDLCIVGAGALGIAVAQHAKRLGAHVVLADRGTPEAGDGPQQALRLAALQASAARVHAQRHGDKLGLTTGAPKIGMKAIEARAAAVAQDQVPMTSRDRLTALGIDIIRGPTEFIDQNILGIGDTRLRPRGLIIATGAQPFVPEIPGLDEIAYFTPDSILKNSRKLTHLLVIGGGAAAVSLAQTFARLGSDVTLVPQGALLPECDSETSAILAGILAAEGVRIIDGGVMARIVSRGQGTGGVVDLPNGEQEALDVSHVLVAAGSNADLAGLSPDKARLQMAPGSRHYAMGALGQSSNRRIRVVGRSAGIEQWNHALSHGQAVVEAMLLGRPLHDPAAQPYLVMTDPPLAQVGRLPASTKEAKPGQELLRASLVENDYAQALGTGQGLAKVVTTSNGKIAGASLVGTGAAEMAAVLALAMEKNLRLDDLARLSLPYPSLLSTLVALGEAAATGRPPPAWTKRLGAAKRLLSSAMR